MHGANGGRPVEYALYSKRIPSDWQEPYNYFKSDPNYLSLQPEIALAQTNMERFLAICEGNPFTGEMRTHLIEHLEQISKLKEKDAKRLYNEKLVNELIAQQVEREAAILQDVISQYVDATTADNIRIEFARRVIESLSVKPGLSVG